MSDIYYDSGIPLRTYKPKCLQILPFSDDVLDKYQMVSHGAMRDEELSGKKPACNSHGPSGGKKLTRFHAQLGVLGQRNER
jgi:hypothetical protein